MRQIIRLAAALAVAAGLCAIPADAAAQAVTGTLLGNVTDTTGAAVPGTTVTARETQTNVSRTATTNDTGFYNFSSLQKGTYAVEAELQGFKKVLREGVRVEVNTTVRVDLKLEVGQLSETVTVAAETPLLQTDRTDTGRRPAFGVTRRPWCKLDGGGIIGNENCGFGNSSTCASPAPIVPASTALKLWAGR